MQDAFSLNLHLRILFYILLFCFLYNGTVASRSLRIVNPNPWCLVNELPLYIRVDASDFRDIWFEEGLTLSLVFGAAATEVDNMNASFRISGPL